MSEGNKTSKKEIRRYTCIKVLHDDGEHSQSTHFRVVDATDYDEAVAEIERLRAGRENAQRINDAAAREIERLRAALEQYGAHTERCDKRHESKPCSCGWDALSDDSSAPETSRELCPNCGKDEVGTFTADDWFLYGREQFRLLAKDVLFFRCMACSLEYTGEDGEAKRMEAVRAHLARQSAEETTAPVGQCLNAEGPTGALCELQKGHEGPHVGHQGELGLTRAWECAENGRTDGG